MDPVSTEAIPYIAHPVCLPSGERGSLTIPFKRLKAKEFIIIER